MELDGKVGEKVTTFKPDGTYTMVMRFQGPVKAMVARDEGTWSRPDSQHLKLLIKDTKWTIEGATAMRQKEIDAKMAKMKPTVFADMINQPPSEVTWVDDDHVILKDAAGSVHMRRKP